MMTTGNQEMRVYAPQSRVFWSILIGIMCLSLGITFFFLAQGQFPAFLASFLFILGGLWSGLFFAWKLICDPSLIIDSEGIRCQHPFSRFQVKWDEIDAIYRISYGTAFAIDLSPTGILSYFARRGWRIPRWLDPTVPQQVIVVQGNQLSLPIDQLLVQISERFFAQLELYHIDMEGYHEEDGSFQ